MLKKGSAGKDPQTGFGMRFEYGPEGFKSPQVLDIWIKKHPPPLFSKNINKGGYLCSKSKTRDLYVVLHGSQIVPYALLLLTSDNCSVLEILQYLYNSN